MLGKFFVVIQLQTLFNDSMDYFFILVKGFTYRKGGILWQIFGHYFFYT